MTDKIMALQEQEFWKHHKQQLPDEEDGAEAAIVDEDHWRLKTSVLREILHNCLASLDRNEECSCSSL